MRANDGFRPRGRDGGRWKAAFWICLASGALLFLWNRLYEYMDFETDTIGLERMVLIFENDTLKAVAEYR